MKKLITALLLSLTVSVFSQSVDNIQVDVTKLDANELRVYQQLKAEMVADQAPSIITPEKIEKYAEIGKAFGSAFKECWGAVSTDAEKFAQSPAGKLAMFLVAWKIMANDVQGLTKTVVQYIIGTVMWIVITPIFLVIIFRNCIAKKRGTVATEEKLGWFRYKRTYNRPETPEHGDWIAAYGLCYLVFLGVEALVMFT